MLVFMCIAGRMTDPAVRVAPRAFQAESLWLLLSEEPQVVRRSWVETLCLAADRCQLSTSCLLEARRAGRLVGAIWGQVLPGQTALVWPPRLVPGELPATAEKLLAALDQHFRRESLEVAQALLRTASDSDAALLRRFGYQWAADLVYLVADVSQAQLDPPERSLVFEPFHAELRDRLACVVEGTYIGTLDIPLLNGVRRIEDVLDGYTQSGSSAPGRWFFVRHADSDVGCLLAADHAASDQWELVYMGLLPEARGHGWGVHIVRYLQRLAREAGRSRLVLAVDAANGPALATYAKTGFFEWDRRGVLLKVLAAAHC